VATSGARRPNLGSGTAVPVVCHETAVSGRVFTDREFHPLRHSDRLPDRLEVLNRLAAGEIDFTEAMRLLKG
jgi:hypothetical protein